MSAVILPNGSLVFRLPQWTVHVDGADRQIHLRDASSRDELGGAVFASAPVDTVRRVFLLAETTQYAHLSLEFVTGEGLDLGLVPMGEMGKRIAYAVARVARCGITTSLEATRPGVGPKNEAPVAPFYEQETGVLAKDGRGTNIRREAEDETIPRIGWKDEWRDEFIQVGNSNLVTATTVDEPRMPNAVMPTVSAELVDPSEASTKRPRDDVEDQEPTVRIDLIMRAAS